MAESLQGGMEFHIKRHPEKKGTPVPTQGPGGEDGKPGPLPQEGIQEAQKEARELAKYVRDIPKAVVYGFRSNQPRTAEADYVFGQEMRVMAQELPASRIFDGSEKSLEDIASEVDDSVDKVVVLNSPGSEVMGMRSAWNMEYIESRLADTDEVDFMKEWFENPETQKQAGVSPDKVGDEFKTFISGQRERTQRLFPGRPIIITAIGHSWELDAGIFSLMGKKLSGELVDDAGGMIKTMEGARVVIDESGKGTVEYRDLKADLNLESKTE